MGVARRLIVEIRPVAEGEMELLETSIPSEYPAKHRQRLQMQERGQAVYLIAWHHGSPVGHLLLEWAGPPHEPLASRLKGCPHIEDLFVNPDSRSMGVGSQLMQAAEDLARRRGKRLIGLGVRIDNRRARALYERRGYRDVGIGSYQHPTSGGRRHGAGPDGQETDIYMTKEL